MLRRFLSPRDVGGGLPLHENLSFTRGLKFLSLAAIAVFCFAGSLFAQDEGGSSIDPGTTSWMLTSTALVLLMTPGLALFYGGMVRSKNILGTIMHSMFAMGLITIVWVIVGWSIAFGDDAGGGWFGNPAHKMMLQNTPWDEGGTYGDYPDLLFMAFQLMFAIITPALITGAFAERVKFRSYVLFLVLWSVIVYSPLAHWVWGGGILAHVDLAGQAESIAGAIDAHNTANAGAAPVSLSPAVLDNLAKVDTFGSAEAQVTKFLTDNKIKVPDSDDLLEVTPPTLLQSITGVGAMDFAGGTVVHISSGVSALIFVLLIGRRRGYPQQPMPPNNLVFTMLGAGLLWFGWFGFNGGSALASDGLATLAFVNTHICAATAAVAWAAIERLHHGKASALGFASGLVAGLVCITPAAGFVEPGSALIMGVIVSPVCYLFVAVLKAKLGYDDSLDAFGIHGVGGTVGAILTGVFVTDALTITGVAGGGQQVFAQVLATVVTWVFAGGVTLVLVLIVNATIGIRVTEDEESAGLDLNQHGEVGYNL